MKSAFVAASRQSAAIFANRFQRRCAFALALLLLAGGSCLNASAAAWGSLRANNRSPHEEEHGGPRGFQPGPPREHGGGEVFRNREREIARNRGHEWDAGRRVEIERDARERRHLDIDEDRRHSYFWYGYHPGMIIGALPSGFVSIEVGGNPYFYDQGVYYESTPTGYVVVNPPIGAVVPALPPGAEALAVGSMIYYYGAGAFYLPQPQGYLVVQPPLGITVTTLPPGAIPVIINGVQYYQADGAYFLPVMQGGVIVYTTVQP